MERVTGRYIDATLAGERYRAFIPSPLPPEPPLQLDAGLLALLEKANRALGRLDGIADMLPDTGLFRYKYVRKEAVLSSQIKGSQSSLSDLLLFEMDEIPGAPLDDVRVVSNYVAALDHGLKRLREGFPCPCGSCGRSTPSRWSKLVASRGRRGSCAAARSG